MGYFKVIIATGGFGVMTAVACVVLAASQYLGWEKVGWWILAFIGVYAAFGCACGVVHECAAANARHMRRCIQCEKRAISASSCNVQKHCRAID
jgi:hypothetical protein